MAALTKDRNTLNKELGRAISVPLAAGEVVFAGGMVARQAADGFCAAAGDVVGHKVVGVADEGGDNTGGADGDVEIIVRKGVFGFDNVGTVVDQIDLANEVFVSTDNEVEKVGGVVNNIRAGTLDRLEDGQAFIKIDEHAV
jgi:hypothetical protein